MVAGALLFVLLLGQVLRFSIVDPVLWNQYWPIFVEGALHTLEYIAIILPVSALLGFALGWARVSRHRLLAWPVSVYIEFFRGVPPIAVVIFASILGPNLLPERFQSAGLGLLMGAFAIAFHSAAFQAEIFRAGFQSVSHGQIEAALAIGMEPRQSMRHVILPQALRLSLPPLSNEFAVVIKDTSLLAIIAGMELTHLSDRFLQTIGRQGNLLWIFPVWTSVAFVYFVMTSVMTRVTRALERKYRARSLEGISL
jgi:His/Glu/Gln/Arg/opine family amino acid ABC transporter permease subunit